MAKRLRSEFTPDELAAARAKDKAFYRKRSARAKAEGYRTYGTKRYRLERMHKLKSELDSNLKDLVDMYGGNVVTFEDIAPDRLRKLEEAKRFGASEDDMKWLYDLARTHDSQFWKAWRELYNRMGSK
jgi:hypothetical protein